MNCSLVSSERNDITRMIGKENSSGIAKKNYKAQDAYDDHSGHLFSHSILTFASKKYKYQQKVKTW
jgi:hypothetical protein